MAHFAEVGDIDGFASPEPDDESYSRIWYGDGTGRFVTPTRCETDLSCAGIYYRHAEPPDESSWAAIDLDGDGRTEWATESLSAVHSDGGVEDGWTDGTIDLPVSALDDQYFCGQESSSLDQVKQSFFIDVDGDGFLDLYQMEADISGRTHTDTFWLNERSTPRGRIQRIHGPWGGVISLGYAWSMAVGDNPDLPVPVEVIRTVEDESGTTTFTFSGGTFDDRGFVGFTDVQASHESGATTYLKYAVSPGFAGALVYKTEHRSDTTIARFSYNQYLRDGVHLWTFDDEPPYFNPAVRHCELDVGPGYDSGGTIVQSVSVESLAAQCTGYFSSSNFTPEGFGIAYGWDRHPADAPGSSSASLAEVTWEPDGTNNGGFVDGASTAPGLWNPRGVFLRVLPYATLEGDFPSELVIPTQPALPPPVAGSNPTEVIARLVNYRYDSDQRADRVTDRRDPTTGGDDLIAQWYYQLWSTALVGKQEDHVVTSDTAGGSRTVQYGSYAAFGLPGTVAETATNGTGTVTRTTSYTYVDGVISGISRPDGSSESFAVNDCGFYDAHTDGVGRVETREFDAACNETRREWEGSVETWDRDVFGRVSAHAVTPLAGGTSPVVEEEWLYDDVFDEADDRGDWGEPRSAVRYTNGTLSTEDDVVEMTHLDPWGRPYLSVRCLDAGGDSSATGSTILQAMTCDPGTESRVWRGWATDGTPRAESRGFADGDSDVAATWSYSDSLGSVEQVLRPAPVEGSGTWVLTSVARTPGDVSVTDPMAHTCKTSATATTWSRSCEGHPRGDRTVNAWGLVTADRDGVGDGYDYTYDAFGRLLQKKLNSTISVLGGTDRPKWNWIYDPMDRPLVERDTLGNETVWTYDGAGRVLTKALHPGSLGGPVATITTLQYSDYTGTPTSRWVKSTDVNGNGTYTWLDGLDRTWEVLYPDLSTEHWEWNGRGLVETSTDIDGIETASTYDASGHVLDSTVAGAYTTSTAWSAAGDATQSIDPYGVETDAVYTWDGRPAAITRPHAGGSAIWTLGEWTYRDDGQVDTEFRGGVDKQYEYDVLGRRTKACEGGDCADWLMQYTWSYDDADRVIETSRQSSDVTDAPAYTVFRYNGMDWPVEIEDLLHGKQQWTYDVLGHPRVYRDADALPTYWNYDGWGRVVFEDTPAQLPRTWSYGFATPQGEQIARTEPDGGVWYSWLDYAGRAHHEMDPDGSGVRRYFSGNQLRGVEYLDGAGVPIANESLAYDTIGRVSWVWGPADGPYDPAATPATGDWSFSYSYTDTVPGDGEYETARVAPDGETTTWVNTDGVLSSETISDGSGSPRLTSTYSYGSDFPSLEARTLADAAGSASRVTDYFWNRGLRVDSITDQVGSGDVQARTMSSFDAWGVPRDAENVVGSTVESVYGRSTDALGRVTQINATHGGGALRTIDYTYSAASRVTSVDTSWAGGFSYVRSGATGLVDEVREFGAATSYATFSARDSLGRPSTVLLSGGTASIQQSWDQMGRIITWRGDNGTSVDDRAWFYDPRGRPEVVQHTDTSGFWEELRQYDEPGWLIGEERASGGTVISSTQYVYDAGGNRTETWEDGVQTSALSYDGSFLDSVDGVSVTWELDGIATDHAGTAIGRNPDGSESTVDVPLGASYTIERDPWGRPVLTDDGTDVREQAWGNPGGAWPIAGIDENGDDTLYVAEEGMLLGVAVNGTFDPAASDPAGNLAFVGSEWLDTPQSFGQGVSSPTTSTARHLFAGLELLPGTTYHLAQHRLYDSETGRFSSMDPLGIAGGPNRFTYADNDPTRFVDPAGYSSTECGMQSMGDFGFEGRQSPKIIEGPAGGEASPFYGGAPVTYYGVGNLSVLDDRAHWQQGHHTYTWGNPSFTGEAETSGPVATFFSNLSAGIEFWVDSHITVLDFGPPTIVQTTEMMGSYRYDDLVAERDPHPNTIVYPPGFNQGPVTDAPAPTATTTKPPTKKPSQQKAAPEQKPAQPVPNAAPDAGQESTPTSPTQGPVTLNHIQRNEVVDRGPAHVPTVGERISVAGEAYNGFLSGMWNGFSGNVSSGWRMMTNDFGGAMGEVGNGMLDIYASLPMTQARMGNLRQAGDTLLDQGEALGHAAVNTSNYGYHTLENAADVFSGDQQRALAGYQHQMDLNGDAATVIVTAATIAEVAGEFSGTGAGSTGNPCMFGSFPSGTPVLTSRGYVPIEQVRPGDLVWSEDPDTHEMGFRRVLRVITHEVDELVAVSWARGGYGRHELLATPEHPFFVDEAGWVPAAELRAGMHVRDVDGGWLIVAGVELVPGRATVHNFVVEDTHTFFVGEEGAWVHNAQPRIHTVAPDWATKYAHVTSNGIELSITGGGLEGQVTIKPTFSSDLKNPGLKDAVRNVQEALKNPEWKAKLVRQVRAGTEYLKAGGEIERAASGATRTLDVTLTRTPCR